MIVECCQTLTSAGAAHDAPAETSLETVSETVIVDAGEVVVEDSPVVLIEHSTEVDAIETRSDTPNTTNIINDLFDAIPTEIAAGTIVEEEESPMIEATNVVLEEATPEPNVPRVSLDEKEAALDDNNDPSQPTSPLRRTTEPFLPTEEEQLEISDIDFIPQEIQLEEALSLDLSEESITEDENEFDEEDALDEEELNEATEAQRMTILESKTPELASAIINESVEDVVKSEFNDVIETVEIVEIYTPGVLEEEGRKSGFGSVIYNTPL